MTKVTRTLALTPLLSSRLKFAGIIKLFFWNSVRNMNQNCLDICAKVEKAEKKGKGLRFLRYGGNLIYSREDTYNHGFKMANLPLRNKTIRNKGLHLGR